MSKEEILEAINSIIVPNNQKAITADMLANILTEMVNFTPEQSESDTPSSLFIYAGSLLEDGSVSQNEEEMAHNAQVFEILKTSSVLPPISVDGTKIYETIMGGVTGIKFSATAFLSMFATGALAQEMAGADEACMLACELFNELVLLGDGSVIAQISI